MALDKEEMLEDYEADIITLENEDGEEFDFEVIDAADLDETRYLAVVPCVDDAQEVLESDATLLFLRVSEEDGEEFLDIVEDDDEIASVSGLFANRLSELYDIDDEDIFK